MADCIFLHAINQRIQRRVKKRQTNRKTLQIMHKFNMLIRNMSHFEPLKQHRMYRNHVVRQKTQEKSDDNGDR